MATLVKVENGWKAVIRKTGFPTASKTFRLKRDAEDWARRTEDEMVRGLYVRRSEAERLVFGKALDRYMAEVSSQKAAGTQRSEKSSAAQLRRFFDRYALAGITADLVARYRDQRLEAASNDTVRLELALLGHLFTTAIREWQIGLTINPVSTIRKPKPGAGRDRRLSPGEHKLISDALANHSNPMVGWIYALALETGMRSSEITGLRLADVDLERRIARLRDTKNSEARTVPLTRRAVEVLTSAISNPVRHSVKTDLVFFGEPGKDKLRRPYQFQVIWQRIRAGLAKTNPVIATLRFHDLRHEVVSRLVEAGLSDQEVAAISGHKSMQMLRRYTHLRAEDLVAKLDKLM